MRKFVRTYWILLLPLAFVALGEWQMEFRPKAKMCRSLGGTMDIEGDCWRIFYTPSVQIKLPN